MIGFDDCTTLVRMKMRGFFLTKSKTEEFYDTEEVFFGVNNK